MELSFYSVTFSVSWIVVIFLIVAVMQPQLLPTLIEAIKGWSKK